MATSRFQPPPGSFVVAFLVKRLAKPRRSRCKQPNIPALLAVRAESLERAARTRDVPRQELDVGQERVAIPRRSRLSEVVERCRRVDDELAAVPDGTRHRQ